MNLLNTQRFHLFRKDNDPPKDSALPQKGEHLKGENPFLYYKDQSAAMTNNCRVFVNSKTFEYDLAIESHHNAKIMLETLLSEISSKIRQDKIKEYISICDALGLSALVEAHNEDEVNSALSAGARIIGVNNRNLKDFSVDVNNSTRYRDMIPQNVLFVSESGIKTHSDIKVLQNNKTDAVLIGETFMKSENKKKMIEELLYG